MSDMTGTAEPVSTPKHAVIISALEKTYGIAANLSRLVNEVSGLAPTECPEPKLDGLYLSTFLVEAPEAIDLINRSM